MRIILRKYDGLVTTVYGPFETDEEAWEFVDKVRSRMDRVVSAFTTFHLSTLTKFIA